MSRDIFNAWSVRVDDEALSALQLARVVTRLRADVSAVPGIEVLHGVGDAPQSSKSASLVDFSQLLVSGAVDLHTVAAVREILLAALRRSPRRTIILRNGSTTAEIHGFDGNELSGVADVIDAFFNN